MSATREPAIDSVIPLSRPLDVVELWSYDDEHGAETFQQVAIPVVGMALVDGEIEYLVHDAEHFRALTIPQYERLGGSFRTILTVSTPGAMPTGEQVAEGKETIAFQREQSRKATERRRAAIAGKPA